jgi:hypothetical protein
MKWPNEVRVSLPPQARPKSDAAKPSARSDPHATACYENEVPEFVEAEIERRYGSLFSTLPHFRHIGSLTDTISTYVTRTNGKVETVLLFDRSDKRVTVLNELIHLSKKEVGEFTAFIFARYKSVSHIAFNAISADLDGLRCPFQRFVCAEDIVIAPLTTVDEYSAQLTKNTRKSMRRHTNALLRAHPSYRYSIVPPEEVSEELVRHIIGFNKARMADKERVSAYNDKESAWVLAMTSAHGVVGVVTIDGKICAGTVCCNVGGRYFMLVGSHDPAYDQFSLGTLCCYRSICECIERDGTELHLLWGRHPYKTSLGGISRNFDRITVYRDRLAYLRHLDKVMVAAASGFAREARLWLVNAEGQDNLKGRMASRLWVFLRRAKRTFIAMKSKPPAAQGHSS